MEDGVVHQARVEPIDAVKHPIGVLWHAQEGMVEVLVELVPEFDGHVGLGLTLGAGTTIMGSTAG